MAIRRDWVRAYKEAGLTNAQISQRLHCTERQIERLVSDEKSKGWNPKDFRDEVIKDVDAAKKDLVERITAADSLIVDSVSQQMKEGELLPDARDYHQVARRHVGNKQVQENVLKLDPATLSRLEQIMAATDHRLPRALPPSTITAEIIDDPTSPR